MCFRVLFYLAAVLAWMRFVEQPNLRWYVWSLVLYVRRSAEQVHCGYAAGGAFDLALVETRPRDLDGSIAVGAVLCSRVGHRTRGLVVLPVWDNYVF